METKSNLRTTLLKKRNALSESEKASYSSLIFENLKRIPAFCNAEFLLLYASYRSEVSTKEIFDYGKETKKRVFFPKVTGEQMLFYEITSAKDLCLGYQNIMEPTGDTLCFEEFCQLEEKKQTSDKQNKSCILVPGSVFGKDGHRIGYGKGFYDRYLSHNPFLYSIGIGYQLQVIEQCPHEHFDVPLDAIVTEENIYHF